MKGIVMQWIFTELPRRWDGTRARQEVPSPTASIMSYLATATSSTPWKTSCRSSARTAGRSSAGRSWRHSPCRPVMANRSDTGRVGARLRARITCTWFLIRVRCRTMSARRVTWRRRHSPRLDRTLPARETLGRPLSLSPAERHRLPTAPRRVTNTHPDTYFRRSPSRYPEVRLSPKHEPAYGIPDGDIQTFAAAGKRGNCLTSN